MSDPAKYRTREEVQCVPRGQGPDRPRRARPRQARRRRGGAERDRQADQGRGRRSRRICRERARARRGRTLHRRAGGELLMAIELKMPALSPTMEEGTLAKWLVKEGDAVKSGDMLAEIETDKATMEFEAVDEGTIAKILVPEGTDGVKVGTVIALMGGEGEAPPSAPRSAEGSRQPASRSRSRTRRRIASCPRQRRPARELVASTDGAGGSRDPRRHRDGFDQRSRGAARRDGRGNAPRRSRVRDGRGSRRIPGRLQGHPGPARGVRAEAGDRHADHRIRLRRHRHRRGDGRTEAGDRVHDLQLRDAGDRPHHQFGGQDQLHVGRPDALPDRVPRPQRRGQRGSAPSTARITGRGMPACPA